MLVATGQLLPEQVQDFATVGELALDGSVRPVKGALSIAMAAAERGVTQAAGAGRQCRARRPWSRRVAVLRRRTRLAEAVGIALGPAARRAGRRPIIEELFDRLNTYDVDFGDVRGQEFAKRAVVVAAGAAIMS